MLISSSDWSVSLTMVREESLSCIRMLHSHGVPRPRTVLVYLTNDLEKTLARKWEEKEEDNSTRIINGWLILMLHAI